MERGRAEDELFVAKVDKILADYNMAQEEANLADLQIFIDAGELTNEEAMTRHLAWRAARGST